MPVREPLGARLTHSGLAFAGLDVLHLVTDDHLDARRRLGISESDPDVARVQRGPGAVTVAGLARPHATDVLYRSGPGRFGRFGAMVVDTPRSRRAAACPASCSSRRPTATTPLRT